MTDIPQPGSLWVDKDDAQYEATIVWADVMTVVYDYSKCIDYAADMTSCPNGDFVAYGDYAALEAERDALREALEQIDRMEINGVSNIAKWALEESRTALGGGSDE